MDADTYLVLGVVFGALALPSLLSAFSESRPPRLALILAVISGVMMVMAFSTNPMGYTLEDVPEAFVRVFARILG